MPDTSRTSDDSSRARSALTDRRAVRATVLHFVKLNAFQRIMRLWDEVHPYNAVQAFRVAGEADSAQIESAWRATLRAMRVGRVVVRGNEYAHTAPDEDDPRASVRVAPEGESLDSLLSAEMNLRFDRDDGCPFRAFVLRERGSHICGVTYHHWVADSFSIRGLLHEWFKRMHDTVYASDQPARIAREGQWKLFGPQAEGWSIDHAIGDLLRYRTRFSRARRCDKPMGDCNVGVSVHEIPQPIVPAIVRQARRRRVTVNDLLLATIAQAVDRFGANPRTKHWDELPLGTVVDLRVLSGRTMPETFGLFLGFTTTILRPADLGNFQRLLKTISRQNAHHKRTKAPQASTLRMAIGLAEAKLVSARRWAELYRARMPIAAAISNINMNRNWAGQYHPAIVRDYFRVSPTGPMIPLIFTPTTLGDRLNLLITRQTDQIDDARLARIARHITNRLLELANDPNSWEKPA